MNAKTVPQLVANFGPIEAESVFEGWPSYREFVSSPAVDYKLMLRDVVNLCVRMGEMPNLNYHYSVGGVELSRDNAEASDVRAVLKSTGWLDEEKPLSNFEQELVDKGNLLGSEAYAKPFQDENGRYWYMPYHRIRDGGQSSFVAYNSDMIPEGYEIRSFSRSYGEPENFPNQVRTLSFISVSAQSLRSKQLVEKGVDLSEADLERVGSWEKFLNSWKSVIEKYGLEYVPLENRFMEMRLSDGGKRFVSLDPDDKKEYAHFMQDLEVLSRTNLEFRSEVRKLVTEYKRSMRQASYKDEIN